MIQEEKPPFVDNHGAISFRELKGFILKNGIEDNQKDFLVNVWQWVVQIDGPMSIHTISDRSDLSSHGVRNRCEKFVKIGLFKKVKRKIEGSRRPVTHYRFHCVDNHDEPIEGKLLPHFNPDNEMMIDHARQKLFADTKIDDLICTSLFSALPFKPQRKALEHPLTTTVNWFEKSVKVITRSETGKPVAAVSDLRFYIAILSICYEIVRDRVRSDRSVENAFALDLQDVHSFMGRAHEGGNIETALKAFSRLSSTSFEIPHVPIEILNKFDSRLDNGFEKIQPLHDFSCYWGGMSDSRRKTIIKFGLPLVVFKSMMMEKFLFKVNPKLFFENSDVILGFHLWCRRRLGSKPQAHETNMKKLHLDVAPTLSYKEFEQRFFKGLVNVFESNRKDGKGFVINESNKSSEFSSKDEYIEVLDGNKKNQVIVQMCNIDVYGYKIMRTRTSEIVVYQNAQDKYVGLGSAHNQAIHRRRKELVQETMSMPTENEDDIDNYETQIQSTLDI